MQNHDTERNGDALSYKVGARNTLATEWPLASGYGTPQVYSGFTWDAPDPASLPTDARGDDRSGTPPHPPRTPRGWLAQRRRRRLAAPRR